MKKRAVLFGLILCTMLCFALPAMAETITCTDYSQLQAVLTANKGQNNTVVFTGNITDEDGQVALTVPSGVTLNILGGGYTIADESRNDCR